MILLILTPGALHYISIMIIVINDHQTSAEPTKNYNTHKYVKITLPNIN